MLSIGPGCCSRRSSRRNTLSSTARRAASACHAAACCEPLIDSSDRSSARVSQPVPMDPDRSRPLVDSRRSRACLEAAKLSGSSRRSPLARRARSEEGARCIRCSYGPRACARFEASRPRVFAIHDRCQARRLILRRELIVEFSGAVARRDPARRSAPRRCHNVAAGHAQPASRKATASGLVDLSSYGIGSGLLCKVPVRCVIAVPEATSPVLGEVRTTAPSSSVESGHDLRRRNLITETATRDEATATDALHVGSPPGSTRCMWIAARNRCAACGPPAGIDALHVARRRESRRVERKVC
ncbi:uncharacterized protein SOCE26_020280 [Sorangium cellulosum]|uniref:Uncharacterized protein n=1 Tax=Sorangium cellulosum TaxID=56 RepID=A0A2L0EMU7_SORCE|nr:uncharacterized protein SOCE26_020280 [Sorangium cellulosum]